MNEQPNEIRRCGRPTRSGKPCQSILYGYEAACAIHATDHDRELAKAYRSGFERGYEVGTATARNRVEWLERRVQELERGRDDVERFYEVDGDQVVEVDGKLSYRWRGYPRLEVGDRVLLPENDVSRLKHGPGPWEASVTRLGTTYRGTLSFVVRRLPSL